LISLILAGNQISNLNPLKELNKLRVLDLRGNKIINLEPLKRLKNIKELLLASNPLKYSQIEELEKALPETDIIF